MADAADTGFGITITFASGFLAEIIGCTPPAPSREEIDISHSTVPDGAMLFLMSDLINYGELGVEINFKADAVPPIEEDFEPTTINFPSGTTWAFSGALKEYAPEAPIDDRMTATATIKVSGKITITPAA